MADPRAFEFGRVLRRGLLVLALALVAGSTSVAGASAGAHVDPVAPVALGLAVILAAALVGGHLAIRLGQPAVLGELCAGILLGNLDALGVAALDPLASNPMLDMLARIGVLLLLFEVGVESTVRQMLSVGVSSLLVALIGVAAPFVAGWGIAAWLLPDSSGYTHAFLAATLTATSVGITARVLRDLGHSQTPEARVILGAAVIDDVLGLVILAVVGGVVAAADRGGTLPLADVVLVCVKAFGFLASSLALGVWLTPRLFRSAARLEGSGVLLGVGLSFCFILAWLAGAIGLAPIVGAFAAGLILEELHSRYFEHRGDAPLDQLLQPISSFLVPVFFVLMGMRTDLAAFGEPGVFWLALALTVAAIVAKQLAALGVVAKGVDRLSIGIGMVPRGEVGLIFADAGLAARVHGAPVLSPAIYSAIVVMVLVTTMITPPLLRWSLARRPPSSP